MAAAMFDEDRMVRRGRVEILASQLAALAGLGIVVHKTDDPITRRGLGGPFANGILNGSDGAQIAIYPAQVPDACVRRMRVCVDESGHDGLAADIDLASAGF